MKEQIDLTIEKEYTDEPCGNRFDVHSIQGGHAQWYRDEFVETPDGLYKRTYCDQCTVYWDEPYKDITKDKLEGL